jgi:hypothetical protein
MWYQPKAEKGVRASSPFLHPPATIPSANNPTTWQSARTYGVLVNEWHAGSSKDPQLANAGRGNEKEQAV